MRITLPNQKTNSNAPLSLEFQQLVVIGANGSGKTRFGSQIEQNNLAITHRISAQKSLTMPESISPKSRNIAEKDFFYGSYSSTWNDSVFLQQKLNTRWSSNPNTSLLNDYEKLMTLLYTEEFDGLIEMKHNPEMRSVTKLDRLIKIWEAVLPHRKIKIRSGNVEVFPSDLTHSVYNASEMSDGERVVFYLIGEVLCAPSNAIIIIDEPELHLHKSIVKNLFDLIENERTDCVLIYLTHDIDFAFTRQNATKIWAKSYEGNKIWDYEILNNQSPIPEQLYLEILGSRKPILFLEGDDSSLDYQIYSLVFPGYTVKPLGGCEKVILSVKSLNEQNQFHHINAYGLIDRDRKQQDQVQKLNDKGIWVLDVAEVENLLLLEDVVKAIAEQNYKNPNEVFNVVKLNVLRFFQERLESQVLIHFKDILTTKLSSIVNFTSRDISGALNEIDNSFSQIDKANLYQDIKQQFDTVVSLDDYQGALKLFNLKNALIVSS